MRRFFIRLTVVALVAMFAPALPGVAGAAQAAGGSTLGYTLEGCQQDGPHAGHIPLPNGNGDFVCPDNAYTTGNLAKGWNELDLVPHRVILTASQAESDTITLSGDQARTSGGIAIGWDFVSAPVLSTYVAQAPGCVAPTNVGSSQNDGPSVGGTFSTAYRTVTFSMPDTGHGACTYDYYQRLALGSHNFPGSSLQSYVVASSGQKRISLPVKESLPPDVSKTMTGTQNASYAWDVSKQAAPASLDEGNTCSASSGTSARTAITVTWTRFDAAPNGDITVLTDVFVKNNAARSLTVSAADVLTSSAGTQTHSFGPTVAPGNGTLTQVGTTWQTTVPSGTTNISDTATFSFVDTVSDVAIPGTLSASAGPIVVQTGSTSDSTASITDSESITGTGLTFSVVSPSVGSFTGGYVAGTPTTGPVGWSSGTVSGSGSVTFDKTVYAANGTSTSSGALSDTAILTTASGVTHQADLTVNITSTTLGTITLTKTVPNVLQGTDTASFTFHLATGTTYSAANDVATHTFAFDASTPVVNGRPTLSFAFTNLAAGDYVLHEDVVTGWAPQADRQVSLTGAFVCGDARTVDNQNAPATASALKVTVPAGFAGGFGAGPCITDSNGVTPSAPCPWAFTLAQTGTTFTRTLNTDSTGNVNFGDLPGEGSYTITEVMTAAQAAAWDQTGSSGCSFTVNYPANDGQNFACTITNTERGHIVVYKHTNPSGDPQTFTFTPSYNGGTPFALTDGQSNDSGALTPGSYSVAETEPAGWTADPAHPTTCTDGTTSYAAGSITLVAGRTVRCDFYNVKYAHLTVLKTVSGGPIPSGQSYTFQLRSGASTTSAGSQLSQVVVDSTHDPVTFPVDLLPGTYQVCEVGVQAGWMTSLSTGGFVLYSGTGDNSTICHDETVGAGDNITVTVDNTPPPGGGARTIGYWKNWSSCKTSGGKQAPVLDRTLYSMEPGGLVIGALTLHDTSTNPDSASDCVQVVRLLNKSTIDTGTKMASDPAFGLAAQLVAALLNKAAGATFPSCAASAATDAETLLSAINFNGVTHTAMTSAQKQQANSLATALDNYNNYTTHC